MTDTGQWLCSALPQDAIGMGISLCGTGRVVYLNVLTTRRKDEVTH